MTLAERLEKYSIPEPNSACLLWVAGALHNGYGSIRVSVGRRRSRAMLAHRVAYELTRGPIPVGLQLDHLCRVRSCINPQHLEAVPQRVNLLRGIGFAGAN